MNKQTEALKLALDFLMTRRMGAESVIDALQEALAQPQEPNNFCPRCGKRLQGVLGQPQVHTCTPPLWGHT